MSPEIIPIPWVWVKENTCSPHILSATQLPQVDNTHPSYESSSVPLSGVLPMHPRNGLTASRQGFTLVELLLVVAIIGVLSYVVITSINPSRHLAQAHDAKRQSDVLSIVNAANQYLIDHATLPAELTTVPQNICRIGVEHCSAIDFSLLVSEYIADLPMDPLATGDFIGYTARKDWKERIVVEAPMAELTTGIMAVN